VWIKTRVLPRAFTAHPGWTGQSRCFPLIAYAKFKLTNEQKIEIPSVLWGKKKNATEVAFGERHQNSAALGV
jgi:hypothetical protein